MVLRILASLFVAQMASAQVCDLTDTGCLPAGTSSPKPLALVNPDDVGRLSPVAGDVSGVSTVVVDPTSALAPTITPLVDSTPLVPPTVQAPAVVDFTTVSNVPEACNNVFASNGYVLSKDILRFCQRVNNAYTLQALQLIAVTHKNLDFAALSEVPRIHRPEGVQCVKLFIDAGYDPRDKRNFNRCSTDAKSTEGLEALRLVLTQKQVVKEGPLRDLLHISSSAGVECTRQLVTKGYKMGMGNLAAICGDFRSLSSVQGLQSALRSSRSLSDDEIAEYSR